MGGVHHLDGVPICRSKAMGAGSNEPVLESNLLHILGPPAQEEAADAPAVVHVSQEHPASAEALAGQLQSLALAASGSLILVIDATSTADMQRIAQATWMLSPPPLLVGSAGLAAEIHPLLPASPRLSPPLPRRLVDHVVLAIGSQQGRSAKQTEALRHEMTLQEVRIRSASSPAKTRCEVSQDGQVALFTTAPGPCPTPDDMAHSIDMLCAAAISHLDEVRARRSNRCSHLLPTMGLIATGGWTLARLMQQLEVQRITIREAVSGTSALCHAEGGRLGECWLVTKGGALGEDAVFVQSAQRMLGARRGRL